MVVSASRKKHTSRFGFGQEQGAGKTADTNFGKIRS